MSGIFFVGWMLIIPGALSYRPTIVGPFKTERDCTTIRESIGVLGGSSVAKCIEVGK